VRGAPGNGRPYRDQSLLVSENGAGGRGAELLSISTVPIWAAWCITFWHSSLSNS
jgi:hypothetical protein